MQYSVSTYSFSQLLQSGEYKQHECITLAKEMGFDAIEFTDLIVPEGSSVEEYAALCRKTAEEAGIPIIGYLFHADFLTNEFDGELTRTKEKIDIGALLGARFVRHDICPGRCDIPFSKALPTLTRALRALCDYSASKGMQSLVENHGFYCQRAERMERLYEATAHENFRLLIDMGNFLCDDDEPACAVSRLAPFAGHVHAKDFFVKPASSPNPGWGYFLTSNGGRPLRPTIIGHGDADIYACLKALTGRGYDGYITVEFEGIEACKKAVETGLQNLKNYMALIRP